MSEPNIPSVPQSLPADQAKFFGAMKSAVELLMGQGRVRETDRAARYGELSTVQNSLSDLIDAAMTPSGDTPDPPTDLIIEQGMWVHFLAWANPEDPIVSHIEIWVSTNTQSRSEAVLKGIVTVTDALRGEQGKYTATIEDITADYTYWIRSVSYGGNVSTWEPPDSQGGYVVVSDGSIGDTIDDIMSLLRGEAPPLYNSETVYSFNNRCRTSDERAWKYINLTPSSGHEPPDATYWERSGILLTGDVGGIPTVGIDGNLVVDQTILARHLQAETIFAYHINTGEAFIGLTIQSENFDGEAKTGWQISNNGSKFYNGEFLFGPGSSGYGNITDTPDSLYDINNGEFDLLVALYNFASVTYPEDIELICGAIDGKIDTWFTTTDPSASWEGTDPSHEGDMWWNSASNELRRWSGTTWSIPLTDQTAIDAYANAATAQDTADGKRRVFIATPTAPYDAGDLWDTGSGIKRALNSRASTYYASDWVLISDVTQSALDIGAAIDNAKANGQTLISGGYIRTSLLHSDVILVGDIGDLAYEDSVGYAAITGTKPPTDADKTSSNSAAGLITGADISYAKANGFTLISGGYLNTNILKVGSAQIDNASIGTLHLAGQAVTVPMSANSGSVAVSSTSWTTLISISSFPSGGGDVLVQYTAAYGSAGAYSTVILGIFRDGVEVRNADLTYEGNSWTCGLSCIDTGATGTHTYYVKAKQVTSGTVYFDHQNLSLLSAKR